MASIKVLIFLVWILFGLGSMMHALFETEYDRILIFKEPLSNKALEGHLIRTVKVSDEGNCRLKCYLEPNCVSVNVGPLDEGTHICELNNDTDESPSHLALVERQLYTYYAVENPCHCKPCPGKYALCQVGFTDKGFRCNLREGYRGEQCNQDFIPGEGSLSGSCYKVFTAPDTWNNAQANCKSFGAQLVKIESAEENDFLVKTFLTASEVTYWMGLSDQEKEDEWIWTDGSLLVNYTNWGNNNPNNLYGDQNCGHIVKGSFKLTLKYLWSHSFSGYNGEWNDLECYAKLGYICEQFFSITKDEVYFGLYNIIVQ